MGAMTDNLETAVLNTMRGSALAAWTPYLALFTAAPGELGGGTEVAGGSYARQAITFGAPDGTKVVTTADILFPVASAAWGTVTHFAVMDAAAAGTMKWYGAVDVAKTIALGDQYKVAAGGLQITLD